MKVIIRFVELPPEEAALRTRRLLRLFTSAHARQAREEAQRPRLAAVSSGDGIESVGVRKGGEGAC